MKRISAVSILIFISFSLQSQIQVPKKCYMHLVSMTKGWTAEMHLVKVNDSLFGEIFSGIKYPDAERTTMLFAGKAQGANITLWDPDDENGFRFKGKFTSAQEITGSFTIRKDPARQITFREDYSNESTPMVVYYQEGKTSLTRKPGSPVAHIGMVLLYPAESAGSVLPDSLKKIILQKFTGKTVKTNDPEMLLRGLKQVYFETYISTNESIYKPGMGQSFDWEMLKYMHIVNNSSDILTFYVEDYAFTGGAHGMQTREYTTVRKSTGKIVELDNIFKPGYESTLKDILTAKAKKQAGLEADKSLTDGGFFVDEIEPNDNFYICGNGIGFFYNHYEISPYSYGPEDYFIPFREMNDILKPDFLTH